MLMKIATDFENFIHIASRKQKLQLSILKCAILQLISLCLRHSNTENVDKAFRLRGPCLAGLHINLVAFIIVEKYII